MYQVYICDDEQEVLLQLSEKIKIELERLALEADYTLVILSYLEKNQSEEAKQYTSKILDKLNAMYTYISVGNSLLNFIINSKLSKYCF